jgi:hypothetical protein
MLIASPPTAIYTEIDVTHSAALSVVARIRVHNLEGHDIIEFINMIDDGALSPARLSHRQCLIDSDFLA